MEEQHDLSASQLLALPRRELQARAKAVGVAANLKSVDIVQAILSCRYNAKQRAFAAADARNDVVRASGGLTLAQFCWQLPSRAIQGQHRQHAPS